MIANLKPVTITGETMAVLRKEKGYGDLLALYVTYAEVSQWQDTRKIRATTSFMAKRMGWGRDKLIKTKQKLATLGLVEDIEARGNDGRITGHYIGIKYVVSTQLKTPRVDETDTSACLYKEEVLEDKKIPEKFADANFETSSEGNLTQTFSLVKQTPNSAAPSFSAPAPIEAVVKNESKSTEVTVNALHYAVIKKYQLPVTNHNEVRAKSKRMEEEVGKDDAIGYLKILLDIDWDSLSDGFKPELSHSRDVYDKRRKILKYLADNTGITIKNHCSVEDKQAAFIAAQERDAAMYATKEWGF